MLERKVTIFGGSGMIGRCIVQQMASLGYNIYVPTRNIERAKFLSVIGNLGQVQIGYIDFSDTNSISNAISSSYMVINCLGIADLGSDHSARIVIASNIAMACRKYSARLIHLSQMPTSEELKNKYILSCINTDSYVRQICVNAIILQINLVWGKQIGICQILAAFASRLRYLPITKDMMDNVVYPIYVQDIAKCIAILTSDTIYDSSLYMIGQTSPMSMMEVYSMILNTCNVTNGILKMPNTIFNIALYCNQFLPSQFHFLKPIHIDIISSSGSLTQYKESNNPLINDYTDFRSGIKDCILQYNINIEFT